MIFFALCYFFFWNEVVVEEHPLFWFFDYLEKKRFSALILAGVVDYSM